MKYVDHFRELARRCRRLSKTAVDPELIEQSRVWAVDFADEADEAERRAVERERLSDEGADAVRKRRILSEGRNALRQRLSIKRYLSLKLGKRR
jgi:hypothetical protein